MSYESDYKAGYRQAMNDVCDMFDREHVALVRMWKDSHTTEDELSRQQIVMETINDVICKLNIKLM